MGVHLIGKRRSGFRCDRSLLEAVAGAGFSLVREVLGFRALTLGLPGSDAVAMHIAFRTEPAKPGGRPEAARFCASSTVGLL